MFMPNVNKNDFASLCICAIRYCQGRRTYMPEIITSVVLSNLDNFTDRDLGVMISDCEYQKRIERHSNLDEMDRRIWRNYEDRLNEERDRRMLSYDS